MKTSGAFLTVHEYVSAVHPWLMGMCERLLDALSATDNGSPWPPETRLAVLEPVPPVIIDNEKRWPAHRRRPVVRPPGYVEPTPEERARRVMEEVMATSAARIREQEAAEAQRREMESSRDE